MIKQIYRNIRDFGLVDGFAVTLCTSDKELVVTPPRLRRPLVVRAGTTDLQVLREIFSLGVYELHPLRKMCPNFSPRTIADCGAYVGYSSSYFANRFPNAKILAVEPQADNYEVLVKNTSQFENIQTINKALWHSSTTVCLGNPDSEKWGCEFEAAETSSDHRNEVSTITVPEILQWAGGYIDLLKIDIEGAEREIFQADCDWLDSIGVLIIELHDGTRPGCSRSVWNQLINRDFCMLNQHENLVLVSETLLKDFRRTQAGTVAR